MAFSSSEWKPSPKQAQFLALPWTIREALFGGGNGSGKSDLLLIYPLVHKLHENPNFKQVFQRRTYPELKNEIVPRSRELYTKFGATFNKTDMCWSFPRPDQIGGRGLTNSGAMILLGHCQNEEDAHNYDSMEINLYTPDELTSYTEFIYLYIGFTRVRTSDLSLPAIIRAAGMPGGPGHTFVKKRFIEPYEKGGKIIIGRGGNKRVYIHSTQADNPHIDPAYKQSLEGLPEAEKRARLYGDWNAYLGQVFDEFRDKHYPDEPENALHVVPKFDIPKWWPRIVAGDWGYAAQTYILYGAVSPTKRLYLYQEQSYSKMKIEEWAPFVKECIDHDNPRRVVFCKSTNQSRGQEHTVQEQIESALGIPIELSDHSSGTRIAGKLLIHEYLRWKDKYIPEQDRPVYNDEQANWILRNRGLEAYKAYHKLFDPPEIEDNLPKLQIFPECKLLIEAIKACSYDKPKDNKPAEDVAEFSGDDPYDTLRYICDIADSLFDEAGTELRKYKQQEALIQRLAETNDWTPYYRGMGRLEASDIDNNEIKPVSRYHHRSRMI